MRHSAVFIILLLGFSGVNVLSAQVTYLEKAKTRAVQENKEILMVFSGSDWCKPCIQFNKDIMESEIFATYKTENIVHLELDFPYRKKNKLSSVQTEHNEALAEQYNPKGEFPTILIADADGEVINRLTYKKGMRVEDFVLQLEAVLQ